LKKAEKSFPDGTFIEGMACVGGCVGGAGCLNHAEKNRIAVDKFSDATGMSTITGSVVSIDEGIRS
jgi:iron only hydrogenase large subunit-like protein